MKKKALKQIKALKKQFADHKEVEAKLVEAYELIDALDIGEEETTSNSSHLALPTEIKSENQYALFSDGACRGNPGPGSWAMMIQNSKGELILEGSGVETVTTNNKMELEGALQALVQLNEKAGEYLVQPDASEVFIYSDSKYVVDGMNSWVQGWKNRGWKKADRKVPENIEQWKALDAIRENFFSVNFLWVKGHSGHPQNEYCDRMANQALDNSGF